MKNTYFLKLKHSIVLFCSISILMTIQACESIVDIDLPDNRINQEDVFKDLSTTKSSLTNLYIKVRDTPFLSKANTGVSFSLSLFTDETTHIGNAPNSFYLNNITASSNEMALWWNNAYQDIYPINAFIIGLSKSHHIQEQTKKQLLGEAYTLRALYYQNLVQLFGDIPYTTSIDYTDNTRIKKTSYQEVLLLIEKDLLFAYENLSYTYRDSQRFYINKSVAELLLSNNYLLQRKYDKAELFSKAVIDNPNYKLEDDINKVFKNGAKSTLWQLSPNLNTAITPEAAIYQIKTIGINTVSASKELVDLFSLSDLRYHHWLLKVTLNDQEFHQINKYKNTANNTDEFSIFFRLEEAYFNLSISLALQDKLPQAIENLNIIRQKRGLNSLNSSLDKDSFIKQYLEESSREFFTENGKRFFDLKLTQKIQDLSKIKPNWKSNYNLFPIPEKQLQMNKNLLPNNIGY
ncbi:RagB/SusD family nutrient uptake outer membrane protein [Myroides marinus]|uniref:RagB/SusD family nutrient uptake outer membrane protein n=1 Tax=Myroides marinus TaxID=703342 RepID=UPI002579169C|nr:RagB/SusD family nutrient uptake outer membrane protein [Myroides marinus]MDM1348839.1 RagB/SusD family nutrient uptake outer membrane protein [Myroides marinus]MDM1352524.1 RagB/SusD family nutrient uptake outer membrane protein [Myroides marinus]MDM1359729.1 RagB/SusD family nutrient uptake outer membrane protein [Myroides marinus]MDM1363266.1 RagB/SusD family nutrient uptake outer membrane protein [Myroides marinus]MDM1366786.1 RagB/SusD family nutrient uptake outer membrane protein [Myr